MGDFDLMPPPMPGERKDNKTGFLKKIFGNKQAKTPRTPETVAPLPPPAPEDPQPASNSMQPPNLDDIKRKLGIVDEPEGISQPEEATAPNTIERELSSQKVEINDWTKSTPVVEHTKAEPQLWSTKEVEEHPMHQEESIAMPAKTDDEDISSMPPPKMQNNAKPLHHELIEQHLAEIDREHEKVIKKIEELSQQNPITPEWTVQTQEIMPDQYFILRNGQQLKSLAELKEALEYIDDITFEHHVNEYRNDFSNWIRDVIQNPDLAKKIAATTERSNMVDILLSDKQQAVKESLKEQKAIQHTLQKRKENVKDLLNTEKTIDALHQKLIAKSGELLDNKKNYAKNMKNKLDAEVERKLKEEKESLKEITAKHKQELQEYKNKLNELNIKELELNEREKQALVKDFQLKKEKEELNESKKEIAPLLAKTESVKKDLEQMKIITSKNEKLLKEMQDNESSIKRKEEAISAKEKKITNDLTNLHEMQAQLEAQKAAIAKEKDNLKKEAEQAEKIINDAKFRKEDALALERSSREKMQAEAKQLGIQRAQATVEMKKLESIKLKIERGITSNKAASEKLSNAVNTRMKYDTSISKTKQDIAKERNELENNAYASMIEEKLSTSPAGQPESIDAKEILRIKHVDVYEKVEACKHALELKDLSSAKQIYNELRDLYAKTDLGPSERETLYTDIRELYDDIHLMMLG